ncbi:ATP-binding protein [Aeoliella sp. SH292]|uniref:ATP-binding protein n=1 Tax=Aeoliella sp. SH292 TaxID=3454464 RepID=UPI003F9857FF
MSDLDQLGSFYLGREHDLATATTSDVPLLYKSKDLTTHAVCVGMTGSGKTGLCLSLLEEAALDGIPAICIDPKGDLGNLLLAFPDFDPAKFRPWIDESEATRKGQTPDEFAASTATMWKEGLAKWDEDGERVQKYCDSVERVIYTPGSTAGIPISVLKSFSAPAAEVRDDSEALRDRVESAASGLLALVGGGTDPVNSREHILIANILLQAWLAGEDLSIADIVERVLEPKLPGDRVGSLPLEDFYPKKDRQKLAVQLNNLLASPSFAGWMEGVPLSIQDLLYSAERKPRLSILSIAHLNDAERMFFVTILLNELVAWIRTQPGTSSLRAILYMDEVFGYFPPVGEPPSKRPMLTLLKQARAFGVGVVLATQNPVDLDYKGLSNCGTWLLGRLQTERDKARVIEGLQGASAEAGSKFDKQAMERTLSSLGNRVFLMNNVHDDASTVFNTRWAMSYLAGPLTQSQIKTLMNGVRDKFSIVKPSPPKPTREMTKGEEKPLPPTPPVVVAKRAAVDKEIEKLKKKQSDAWYQFVTSMGDAFRRTFDFVSRTMGKRATTRSQSTLMTSLGNVWEKFWKWRQASAPLRPYVQHAKKLDRLERRLQKLQLEDQENAAEIEKVEAELLELAKQEVVVG